jgi:hypothetical protein
MAEMHTLADRSKLGLLLINSMSYDAILATFDGHLEEAVTICQRMLTRGGELGVPISGATLASLGSTLAYVHLGNAGPALERNFQTLRDTSESLGRDIVLLYLMAHLGRYAEVADMLERLVVKRHSFGSAEDGTPVNLDIIALEAAVLAQHR